MSALRPDLPNEIPLQRASKMGLISEINRVLLHPAGYRLQLVRPTPEMKEEAAEQGWPEPGLSLALIDDSAERGGCALPDEVVAAHLDTLVSGAKLLAKRTVDRRPDRQERFSFHRQPLPNYEELG